MKKQEQRENLRILLGFKENYIMNREEHTVTSQIEKGFTNEKKKKKHTHSILF